MLVHTEQFGELEIDDAHVITFAEGLPGFPEATRFALLPVDGSDDIFYWLQSLDDPGLSFLAAVPWSFFPDYAPELADGDQELLGLGDAADALVLCLLTVHRDEQRVTANLLGPVVINRATRAARQIVLAEQGYDVQAALGPAA